MPDAQEIANQSVTRADYNTAPTGLTFFLSVPHLYGQGSMPDNLAGYGFREADQVLSTTAEYEAMWAASIFIAKTKMSALAWEIEGDIPLRVKRAQEILHQADMGRGWVSFLDKHLQDYLTTNNGAPIEIVRQKQGVMNSPIVSLIPLDSLRCVRTGDPEIPFLYRDLQGRQHELKDYEVIDIVDEPSPRANLLGSGRCAAARAYRTIYTLYSIETYLGEKVSGRRPTTIHFVNGLNATQLEQVLKTAQEQADAKGVISYMGAIVATVPGEAVPGIASVPLAEIPDGFDRKTEFDRALLSYANNIGLDPQDLQPISNQQIGAGAQSAVLDSKSKGRGLASWRQQFTHMLNNWVIPDMTEFIFIEKDWRDNLAKARADSEIEKYVSDSVAKTILTPQQGLQKLVDEDIYPKEFLPVDQTPDTSLTDDEKPEEEAVEQPAAADAQVPPEPVAPEVQAKAIADRVRQKAKKPAATVQAAGSEPDSQLVIHASQDQYFDAVLKEAFSDPEMTGDDIVKLRDYIEKVKRGEAGMDVGAGDMTAEVRATRDESGNLHLFLPQPAAEKQADQQPIVVNIPAPVVNVTIPPIEMAAPVINVPAQRPPQVTLTPNIQVNLPEPKPAEFEVRRDTYGNVLGITEKQ